MANQATQLICNQFGAGNGKTFVSIMLVGEGNSYPDAATRDKVLALQQRLKTQEKQQFLFLVKMNAAKDVILTEMMALHRAGRLRLPLVERAQDAFAMRSPQQLKYGNQYIVPLVGGRRIVIATIDSFYFSIYKQHIERGANHDSFDFFGDVAKAVAQHAVANTCTYKSRPVNELTLILVDEIQDLSRAYSDALKRISAN